LGRAKPGTGRADPVLCSSVEGRGETRVSIRKGSKVEWKWGASKAFGKVVETFHEDVDRKIDGKSIKRKASKDEPAYLIEQEDGQKVLKSASEVSPAS
jgi:hypothetical protein